MCPFDEVVTGCVPSLSSVALRWAAIPTSLEALSMQAGKIGERQFNRRTRNNQGHQQERDKNIYIYSINLVATLPS
jgi:hypothetical protein